MAAPSSLSGATTTVKVDGNDLHTYGMIVNNIDSPPPSAKSASVSVSGRDGDFDFSKSYGVRMMTISGYIVADSNTALMSYIDSLNEFFRLRENLDSFTVIFQNQLTREWTCKYSSGLRITPLSGWYFGEKASFSITFKCVKPYAEKTTVTTITEMIHVLKNRKITYDGNVSTPITVKMKNRYQINLLEKVAGDCNEDNTLWTYSNATGSDSATNIVYGASSVKVDATADGISYAEIDVTAQIVTTKYYVFAATVFATTTGATRLTIINDGAGGDKHETFISSYYHFRFVKISAAELAGAASVKFRINTLGTGLAADFLYMDGCFIYEINATEFADDTYTPPPYITDPTGDDALPLVNPTIKMINSYNIFKVGHGDDRIGWNGGDEFSVIPDPLEPSKKCFYFRANGSPRSVSCPKIYIEGGKQYKLSFKYMCEDASANTTVKYLAFNEGPGIILATVSKKQISSTDSTWQTYEGYLHDDTVLMPTNYPVIYINIVTSAPHTGAVYFKEFMIEECAVVDEAFSDYKENEETEADFTMTLNEFDTAYMDFDVMTGKIFDYSENDISNIMSSFSGDRLLLKPGTNILKMLDYRTTISAPETKSTGSMDVVLSYRERYL